MDGIGSKITNSIAKTINDFVEGVKNLVVMTSSPQLFPNLLDGIHFRCIGWYKYNLNIGKCLGYAGFMPRRSIANKHNMAKGRVISATCPSQVQIVYLWTKTPVVIRILIKSVQYSE